VRDCADKRGLEGDRFLCVAARGEAENRRVTAALGKAPAAPITALSYAHA
jgi:hypothetical protein